jgi:hypothetical protein
MSDVFKTKRSKPRQLLNHHAQGMFIRSRMTALAPLRAISQQERFAKEKGEQMFVPSA